MPKTLFVGINSSYVHINPAVRSLAASAGQNASFAEYNINQHMHNVLEDIVLKKPDIAAFSCYIWNIGYVLRLAEDLKKILPGTFVLLGGPEVSFDAKAQMEQYPFIDAVFCGEAEGVIRGVVDAIFYASPAPGLCYRKNSAVCGDDSYQTMQDISALKPPFYLANDIYDSNKIYYYESSRGCPYRCAYCLSGGEGAKLREKPLPQKFAEIDDLIARGVRLVKFTDRTFNVNGGRAYEIWRHIIERNAQTCFHFEIALDLLTDEHICLLRSARPGAIQLEAGVQSLNETVLKNVCRQTDTGRVCGNARAILEGKNIHLHLDLIAGLPGEDMKSFARSFDGVFGLFPDMLQLGFLKVLKGAPLYGEAAELGVVYREYPPYEVLFTQEMRAEELLFLKGVEELLNRYYNSGRAKGAICFLMEEGVFAPFEFFAELCSYCAQNGTLKRPVSAQAQFSLLADFASDRLDIQYLQPFLKHLKSDYIKLKVKGRMPEVLENIQ
ncbi:MAG: DUF4080 domain-containing protein [Christensenellaceae bacterium]|jgi:radical SAM superfamily enzyme YgiQ (UPF0313 family)